MRLDKGTLNECKQGTKYDLDFFDWYKQLGMLTQFVTEFISVNDAEAWKEDYELGKTPHESLREEYPEDKFPYTLEEPRGYQ